MCTSKACLSLLSEAESVAPSECTVGTFGLYADLITPLTNVCNGGSNAGSATSATVGSTDGSATVTASSTGSGDSTTSASGSATASGSSSANVVTVSVGAVLVAIAASFF